jgi:hypothetical protein
VADGGPPDKRAAERALRGAGLSARQAKRVLSGGWRALGADAAADPDDMVDMLEDLARQLRRSTRAVVNYPTESD